MNKNGVQQYLISIAHGFPNHAFGMAGWKSLLLTIGLGLSGQFPLEMSTTRSYLPTMPKAGKPAGRAELEPMFDTAKIDNDLKKSVVLQKHYEEQWTFGKIKLIRLGSIKA